jgi:hypothetical protein
LIGQYHWAFPIICAWIFAGSELSEAHPEVGEAADDVEKR